MSTAVYIEVTVTIAACLILIGYQVLRLVKIRRDPMSTSHGVANRMRSQWVEAIIQDRKDILAVQTMRNWTMAATFLASTAILLGLAFLNFMVTTEKLSEISHVTNFFGSRSPTLLMFKVLSVVILFLFAFYNFTLAVRYYNHVAFMINVPSNREVLADRQKVCDRINRGATHYNLGMNGFYMSIPFSLWILGPGWFLLSAMVITTAIYRLDRV